MPRRSRTRRSSSRSRRRRCSGVKKSKCDKRDYCTWLPTQGCRSNDSASNVAALAQMLAYSADASGALAELQQMNEAAKARAIAKIAAIGTVTSATQKYTESPSAQLSSSLQSLSANASSVQVPLTQLKRTYTLDPVIAAQMKQVMQASASSSGLPVTSATNAGAMQALQRSLSAAALGKSSADNLSPSIRQAVADAARTGNYAALAHVSPGVLSAALSADVVPGLPRSRSLCASLPASACLPPYCQVYKPYGKRNKACRAAPYMGSLYGL